MSSSLTRVFPSACIIQDIINVANHPNGSVVRTTTPHGYNVGMFVTIVIPYPNGTWNKISGKSFLITEFDPTFPNAFGIPLSSIGFGAWLPPPTITIVPDPPDPPFQVPLQNAQCLPAGEFANTLEFATNVIGPNNRP